jgi:hypothetical protein
MQPLASRQVTSAKGTQADVRTVVSQPMTVLSNSYSCKSRRVRVPATTFTERIIADAFFSVPSSTIFAISPTISTSSPFCAGLIETRSTRPRGGSVEPFPDLWLIKSVLPDLWLIKSVLQTLKPASVDLGQIRMKADRSCDRSSKVLLELHPPSLKRVQTLL